MYRYVAFLWNSLDSEVSHEAEGLRGRLLESSIGCEQAFAAPGMEVYTWPPRTSDLHEYPIPDCSGVILGRLFPAELEALADGWKPALTPHDGSRFLATSGRTLTEEYWGAYVAFLHSPRAPHSVVLRDPSGKLPCYRLRHLGIDIVFSDVADLAFLPPPVFGLNLPYLAAFVFRGSIQTRETGLAAVTEVLAGECYEIRGTCSRQKIIWNAAQIAMDHERVSREIAAARLRAVTEACIEAWASVHLRILHLLSGGLDSSIVLGCLARARHPTHTICLNRFLGAAEGDERIHARAVARLARVPLIERRLPVEECIYDTSMLALPKSPRPSFTQCERWKQLNIVNGIVAAHKSDAVWTGQGGDHLFLKATDVESAADFLIDNGWHKGLARAIRGEARLSRRPYVDIWRSALAARRTPGHRTSSSQERLPGFVRSEALPENLDIYLSSPLDLAAKNLAPGRRRQIALVAEVVNRNVPLSGHEIAHQHHPLLSQPILEQCLRTPSYVHLDGGCPRALARLAFHELVPQQVLQREDKGNTTSLVVESIRRSAPFLHELLLHGVLAAERLVERSELSRCLRDGHALMPGQLPALTSCIAAEIWARSWSRNFPSRQRSVS